MFVCGYQIEIEILYTKKDVCRVRLLKALLLARLSSLFLSLHLHLG